GGPRCEPDDQDHQHRGSAAAGGPGARRGGLVPPVRRLKTTKPRGVISGAFSFPPLHGGWRAKRDGWGSVDQAPTPGDWLNPASEFGAGFPTLAPAAPVPPHEGEGRDYRRSPGRVPGTPSSSLGSRPPRPTVPISCSRTVISRPRV